MSRVPGSFISSIVRFMLNKDCSKISRLFLQWSKHTHSEKRDLKHNLFGLKQIQINQVCLKLIFSCILIDLFNLQFAQSAYNLSSYFIFCIFRSMFRCVYF